MDSAIRELLHHLPDPCFVVDAGFRIVDANPAAAMRLAESPVTTTHCFQFLHHLTDPCDETGVECPIRRMQSTGRAGRCRHVHFLPDGSPRDFEGTAIPLSGRSDTTEAEYLLLCRDLSDQARIESKLASVAASIFGSPGEELARGLVRGLAEALGADVVEIAEIEPDGCRATTLAVHVDGSPGANFAYALAGTPCNEVRSSQSTCFYPDRVAALFPDDRMLADMGIHAYLGRPLCDSKGEVIGLIVALWRGESPPEPVSVPTIEIFASRAAAELERLRAERKESRLRDELEQARRLELIGRLAGGVAHDFNNLLTPILAYSEMLLLDLPEEDPRREDLQEILAAAQRGRNLTQQLLAFGRRQVLDLRVVDLAAVVQRFSKTLRRTLREDIGLEIRAPRPVAVRADVSQIERVLLNLALNAQDALRGPGSVTIGVDQVETARPDGPAGGSSRARLVFHDDGTGMTAETLEHAFDPFYSTKGELSGTGLGLPTVQGIVEQHGGTIRVESIAGRGTTFRILFPVAAELPEHATVAATRGQAPGGEGNLLLVEDDEAVRRLASGILRRSGYNVIEFGLPAECVEWLGENATPIDLLVTDVIMPGMNGRQLWESARELRPGLRALFISGHADDVVFRSGSLEPAAEFLPKPLSATDLVARVSTILGRPPDSA